jgi:hypothetical protein
MIDIKQLTSAIELQTLKIIKIEQESAVASIRARNKLTQLQQDLTRASKEINSNALSA